MSATLPTSCTKSRVRETHGVGTSRTKIHLTRKIPFHLSWAQTVELCVSSTLHDISALLEFLCRHDGKEVAHGVSISATPQK